MLSNLDQKLSLISQELNQIAASLTLEPICEFTIENARDIPWESIRHQGIYLLEIQNDTQHESFPDWAREFQAGWEDDKYKWMFVPNLKKKRLAMHAKLSQWIPIYLGKSRHINKRVGEHIFLDLHKNTFALKLASRENMKGKNFRLSVLGVEAENYDWVVPKLERHFRDRINPIIGKQ